MQITPETTDFHESTPPRWTSGRDFAHLKGWARKSRKRLFTGIFERDLKSSATDKYFFGFKLMTNDCLQPLSSLRNIWLLLTTDNSPTPTFCRGEVSPALKTGGQLTTAYSNHGLTQIVCFATFFAGYVDKQRIARIDI